MQEYNKSLFNDFYGFIMAHQQHFLLSAKARTLSVRQVCEMTEQQAFKLFKEVR